MKEVSRMLALMQSLVLGTIVAAAGFADVAGAQSPPSYPNRTIRLIVPYPPGGGGDLHARLIGEKLAGVLNQPVIVENHAGGSGVTGSNYVAKAKPDGYTLLVNTNALAVSQVVNAESMPFNVLTDLAPIMVTMTSQNMLVARLGLPVTNLTELIAYARANPGKVSYGASGLSTPMLSVELLKSMAGINLLFVPYKGDAPGITDLIGDHIDMYVTNILPLQPHVQAGKVRALAVTSTRRAASLPGVPTMAEGGVAGFDIESWFGLLAPAGTSPEIIGTLNAALRKIVAMPEVQKSIADTGGVVAPGTPEDFKRRIESDVAKFGQIVKAANIQAK
ncbi:MAG: Bug family tripartite tricarboxylate transporter substrate binding protein [Lautropia sp.]